MALLHILISLAALIALGLALWCVREIMGLKERWARLYGLRSAMVETETTLQQLMDELKHSGDTIIQEIESRLQAAEGEILAGSDGASLYYETKQRVEEHELAQESALQEVEPSGKIGMVLHLARQGHTVKDIAKELGLPQGEVQLVLDLDQFR